MKTQIVALSLAGLVVLTGCTAHNNWATRETGGTLAGAALGGYLGSQVGEGQGQLAATAVGVVLGGMLGRAVGQSMDQTDRMQTAQALETGRTSQSYAWRNPDTGAQYNMTPTRTFRDNGGQDCREFTTKAVLDGRHQAINGTACRQPDGTWEVVR